MQTIDVLFGFDLPEFEKGIEKYMNSLGYEVNSAVKLTKNSINEYLVANSGCNTAVLVEKIGGSCYSEDELAMLTDKRDINIIVLLDEKKYGTDYMQTLYDANITSAIFGKEGKGAATPKDVSKLILHKRNRKQARSYYGLSGRPMEIPFLTNDEFELRYNRVIRNDEQTTLRERFFLECAQLTMPQTADFIRRLPEELKAMLSKEPDYIKLLAEIKDMKNVRWEGETTSNKTRSGGINRTILIGAAMIGITLLLIGGFILLMGL